MFDMEIGEIADLEVPLRYNGPVAIRVVQVLGECSCSDATIKPSTLRPGDAAKLVITFDSRGKPLGVQKFSFVVATAAKEKLPLKDALLVKLQRNIVIDQPILHLGEVQPGSNVEHSCDVLIKGVLVQREMETSIVGLGSLRC
jgi:hypothetical protein